MQDSHIKGNIKRGMEMETMQLFLFHRLTVEKNLPERGTHMSLC